MSKIKCVTSVGDRLTDEELEDILQSIDLDVDYEGNIKYEGKVNVKSRSAVKCQGSKETKYSGKVIDNGQNKIKT